MTSLKYVIASGRGVQPTCAAYLKASPDDMYRNDGLYIIHGKNDENVQVECDMTTD